MLPLVTTFSLRLLFEANDLTATLQKNGIIQERVQ